MIKSQIESRLRAFNPWECKPGEGPAMVGETGEMTRLGWDLVDTLAQLKWQLEWTAAQLYLFYSASLHGLQIILRLVFN